MVPVVTNAMTPKQRILGAFAGEAVDRQPVAAPYLFLSDQDHWTELTGLPVWKFYEWQCLEPSEHVKMYRHFRELLPFDLFQATGSGSRADRESKEIVHKDGKAYVHNRRTDSMWPVPADIHMAGSGGGANETRRVWTKADADSQLRVTPAHETVQSGGLDYEMECVREFGGSHFIIPGGICNTLYVCSFSVGLTNLFAMLLEEPDLIDYLSHKILEQNIERIRALALAGGDAIYIDDATATCDMISVAHYERFSLPYMREEVREIQALGKKAIVIYFGGVSDRIEQIVSTGADAIMVEASMKGYINDIGDLAKRVANRALLFGNLNPLGDIELSSDDELLRSVEAQYAAASIRGRFITSTGSPLTPRTSVARMRRFVDIAHGLGTGRP